MHSTLKESNGVTHPSYIGKVKYPLHFIVSYVQFIAQQYKSRTARKPFLKSKYSHYEKIRRLPLQKEAIMHHSQINTFHCQQR